MNSIAKKVISSVWVTIPSPRNKYGSNTKKEFISNWGESVAIIWSTAARLFLLSCNQPLLRSPGLPCPDFQMLPAQLSRTKSASLPLIFHLHTCIKQQGPNGRKRLEWWGGICTSAVFSHILRYLEPNAAAKVTGTNNSTEKNHAGPVTTEIWEVPKVSQKTIPDGAFTHKCSQIQNNWMAWDWKTIPKNQTKPAGILTYFLQLTKRQDTEKFQVATGIPSMASERQVYIFHQPVLWYCASLRPWKETKLLHVLCREIWSQEGTSSDLSFQNTEVIIRD